MMATTDFTTRSTMTERVTLNIDNHIAVVTLNRPDKHNGLDEAMFLALLDTAKQLRRNRSVRCVILRGEGPSFCAGLDFAAVAKKPSMVARFFLKLPWSKDNRFQRLAYIWQDLPMPVIAVVHGNCFGGGLQMMLGCDFRVAAPDARLSIMEIKWGLVPDMSGTVTLSRLTRLDIAQELAMTGRIFSGQEGADYGLITRVSDSPLSEAKALAEAISDKSPDAIAAVKLLFKKTWKRGTRASLFWERITQLRLLGRKNQRIAMNNGLRKDAPPRAFEDRR